MQSLSRIVVRAEVVGRRGPAFSPIELQPESTFETIRELLAAIVRQQVNEFRERKAESRFLQVLSGAKIREGTDSGKIISGNQDPDSRIPTVEDATTVALQAFEDGLYYMFVNDVQIESLDQPVAASDVHDVLFVRLTPLVGG